MDKSSFTVSAAVVASVAVVAAVFAACGSDEENGKESGDPGGPGAGGGSPEQTGAVCEQPTDCYPDVDGGVKGDAICLDRVRGGYCTHTCTSDDDCCAAEGECETDLPQVCAPFESENQGMCFLSCEKDDVKGYEDDNEFCQREASSEFICRSSGGGSTNRKICVPGDCGVGAACGTKEDCTGQLECITTLKGGYCGKAECTQNADCPNGSSCVQLDDGKNYCLRRCQGDSDCGFCRPWDDRTDCSADASFVEAGTTGSVCVPTLRSM